MSVTDRSLLMKRSMMVIARRTSGLRISPNQHGFSVRLRRAIAAHLFEHHAGGGLARTRGSAMLADQMQRDVGGGLSAGAGDAIAVLDEDRVGLDAQVRKLLLEVEARVPVHAAAAAFHHAGPRQHERRSTDADDRHALVGDAPQVLEDARIGVPLRLHASADHHDVVELRGIRKRLPRRDLDAAVGAHRLQRRRDHGPATFALAAVVEVVAGDAQRVDETGEREQRELVQQDERDRQLRLVGRCELRRRYGRVLR